MCRHTGIILKILGVFVIFRIVSGINLCSFSGMVPETLRISPEGILRRCDEDPIPSMCKCQNSRGSIWSAE